MFFLPSSSVSLTLSEVPKSFLKNFGRHKFKIKSIENETSSNESNQSKETNEYSTASEETEVIQSSTSSSSTLNDDDDDDRDKNQESFLNLNSEISQRFKSIDDCDRFPNKNDRISMIVDRELRNATAQNSTMKMSDSSLSSLSSSRSQSISTNRSSRQKSSTMVNYEICCLLAEGSPTCFVSNFSSMIELYEKLAKCFDLSMKEVMEIWFDLLNKIY
ncbi:Ig-like and fibronectin type-III domain-containing protein [Sarcoptes scabiei]|nr:Ig-like and fibronectin type-III domain-containing protein [Sarcoptes scabiei]